jgi:hypothetical protein
MSDPFLAVDQHGPLLWMLDLVGSVENLQPIALLRLEQPVKPPLAVPRKQ